MASPDPKKSKRSIFLSIFLRILFIILFMGIISLMTFLAMDVFTIPYLTPFAHFLAIIVSPFVPLMAPLTFGAFLKICQHETFPNKKLWIAITGAWCFNHIQRVWKDTAGLYLGRGDNGEVKMCGLNECKGSWVQLALLCVVVVGQWRGWRWDAGVVDKWVEGIVTEAKKQEEEKRRKAMGGDVEQGVVDGEVKVLVVEEEVVGGDMEKSGLLVEVEEKTVDEA